MGADFLPDPDLDFDIGPNAALAASDYPFRKLADLNDRNSTVLIDTNDVTSSQGVFHRIFVETNPGHADGTIPAPDPDGFRAGSLNVRRVEPRNTPTMINAVFNFSYADMIQAAFHSKWWLSTRIIRVNPDGSHTIALEPSYPSPT